jgi:ABC-type phosphonate transport system ATPase subunit
MTPTVSIAGVVKNYRAVRALRDVSFDLVPGRLSALVGHNGAGKTRIRPPANFRRGGSLDIFRRMSRSMRRSLGEKR